MKILPGDLENEKVIELLRIHLTGMHAASPPGSVFALDLSGLKRPDITFYTAWDGDDLLGCAALRELSPLHGEIKSMRTHPAHLRRGVAAALLQHILSAAKLRGYRRLSLETGSGESFEPAIRLYTRNGFLRGEPFGNYASTSFNQFFHLDLPSSSPPPTPHAEHKTPQP